MSPFLSNLGVPILSQGRNPDAASFPGALNPNARGTWESLLPTLRMKSDPRESWGIAINAFIDACEAKGIFPFQSNSSLNDEIFQELRDARTCVVDFIDRVGLYKEVKVRDVHRKVSMTDKGFVLEVYGIARLLDPSFPEWLTGPVAAFTQMDGVTYQKQIGSVQMFATNDGVGLTDKWHIGYRISVNMYPDIPGSPLASKADLEKFVMAVLWEPAFRMSRPSGLLHRLL